ncbi:MAG: carbamoyltransferase HypF, partial [Actinomycetota bacterium]|nr:carbamoyltransferase HypF [Actinomycetota bacterium]
MDRERRSIRVTGTVQGVGFRPFVYRLAVELGLVGFVANDQAGVVIESEGYPARLDELCRRLEAEPPPLAQVSSVSWRPLPPLRTEPSFRIVVSVDAGAPDVPVSIDVAPCVDCLAELTDPADRRFAYPFINCTNCGPRYTIMKRVPYDRSLTTMASFRMCHDCQAEYDDPTDRRFHAQPNACPACGPRLRLRDPSGGVEFEAVGALEGVVARLLAGEILAVKGIGGYHLATDATNARAVKELRRRKARDDKPFAVMVADLATARRLCELDGAAEEALVSPRRPIVLAPRRTGGAVAEEVAPGLPELGLMLPYSPLHVLLLERVGRPLVMTSGNLSDEPIAHEDEDAFTRLGPLVDAVLSHDRGIHIRCDDSVVRARVDGHPQLVRRSRGYAPEPLPLPGSARRQVLAVGAELKSTVAVTKGSSVFVSHHIGDLEHYATYRSFLQAVDHLCHLFGVEPEVVAHDLHPEYLSTKFASELDLPLRAVQHHHAHVASCLVDHRERGPVLGLAFDGLGFGSDGTLWGGEFLVADLEGFERVGHLRAVPLPGGAAAIREPWRMALAWLRLALGTEVASSWGAAVDERWAGVLSLLESGRSPVTTSMGRLFDAAAALLGIRPRVTYEGQAAIELEALARRITAAEAPSYPVELHSADDGWTFDPAPLLAAMLGERRRGVPAAVIPAGFHTSLAEGAATMADELCRRHGLDTVALSGGVFQNVRLTDLLAKGLRAAGLRTLTHERVPANDGGISVGQAAIAA